MTLWGKRPPLRKEGYSQKKKDAKQTLHAMDDLDVKERLGRKIVPLAGGGNPCPRDNIEEKQRERGRKSPGRTPKKKKKKNVKGNKSSSCLHKREEQDRIRDQNARGSRLGEGVKVVSPGG